MKQLRLLIITSAICLIALFTFLFFRTVPVSRLWKGYQVLYVASSSATEAEILSLLEESGCKNVVSRATQRVPIVSSVSPVQVQDTASYLSQRDAFFTAVFDDAQTAMVFYIPEGQDMALARAMRDIHALRNTAAGTDGTASFPWGSPIICVLFAAACCIFAKNRAVFAPAACFLVLFSFSRPLFTTSAAVCVALYGFFMLQKIWGRRGFSSGVLSPLMVLCLLVPIALLFFTSPLSALFYALALLSAFSAMLVLALLKDWYRERTGATSFSPVPIRSVRMIPLVERKEAKVIGGLLGAVVVIFVLSLAGNTMHSLSAAVSVAQPAVPAPATGLRSAATGAVARTSLPDLDDFMAWSWNTVTFPYRRLTDNTPHVPVDGDRVSFPVFEETDGRIVQGEQVVYLFNSAFRNTVYDSVKNLSYPALEKMMLRQGKDTRYAYAKGGGSASERFGMLLLVLFMLIPAGIIFYFMTTVRKQHGIGF